MRAAKIYCLYCLNYLKYIADMLQGNLIVLFIIAL